jgi:hypothetical protein
VGHRCGIVRGRGTSGHRVAGDQEVQTVGKKEASVKKGAKKGAKKDAEVEGHKKKEASVKKGTKKEAEVAGHGKKDAPIKVGSKKEADVEGHVVRRDAVRRDAVRRGDDPELRVR